MTDRATPRPKVLHHFSEDGRIERFRPHVPRTNPDHPPAVWAIDARHAPLYWFPRDCPRVTAWPRDRAGRVDFERVLCTTSPRVHAIEIEWLDRMTSVELFRYDFDAAPFDPWPDASGQWTATETIEPVAVQPVGDLIELHRDAGIELRLLPALRPFAQLVQDDRWDFSIVRLAGARR